MNLNFTDKDNYKCLKDYLLDFKHNIILKKSVKQENIIIYPVNDYNILINSLDNEISCKDALYNFRDVNDKRHFYCEVRSNHIIKIFLDDQQLLSLQEILNREKSIFYKNLNILENEMEHLKLKNYIIDDCIENFENHSFTNQYSKVALNMVCKCLSNDNSSQFYREEYINEY